MDKLVKLMRCVQYCFVRESLEMEGHIPSTASFSKALHRSSVEL